MPKITEIKRQERRRQIEEAAIVLFTKRGYHGVGLRDIAAEAGVSLGNIYNHFSGKEPIFEAAMERLHVAFGAATEPFMRYFIDCQFPDDIDELGKLIGATVRRHRDYLILSYVDIVEFDGAHARAYYQDLAARFRFGLGASAAIGDPRFAPGVDPAVAFTLVYLQFVNYFVVEKVIGARGHLGLDDDTAIQTIARTFLLGLTPRRGNEQNGPNSTSAQRS